LIFSHTKAQAEYAKPVAATISGQRIAYGHVTHKNAAASSSASADSGIAAHHAMISSMVIQS
jgi:hypothetical protein